LLAKWTGRQFGGNSVSKQIMVEDAKATKPLSHVQWTKIGYTEELNQQPKAMSGNRDSVEDLVIKS